MANGRVVVGVTERAVSSSGGLGRVGEKESIRQGLVGARYGG